MIALLLIVVFAWIATAFGRMLLTRFGLPVLLSGERLAYAGALGLGTAAYGVYALGLLGLLSFWPITLWWLLLAALGWKGMREQARDLGRVWNAVRPASRASHEIAAPGLTDAAATEQTASVVSQSGTLEHWIIVLSGILLLLFGLIALIACFRPPGPIEWDALSYHLADPKLFLQQRRIVSLPTEHHSNFPFAMEMLFAVGLLYNGFALANLFHLLTAFLLVAGMIGFCSRLFHPVVGWLAAVVFVTTPMVLWEVSVAYIDVGLGLYATLAAFAAMSLVGKRPMAKGQTTNSIAYPRGIGWPILAGCLMGFALGMKYLALVPFVLIGLMLLSQRVVVKSVAVYVGIALAIGSPWYIKNVVVMHNPVYPFAYKVFPQSLYWSEDRANAYQSEQDKFGTKPLSPDARSKLLNLMQVPWHLLTRPNPMYALTRPEVKTNVLYCNPGEYTFAALFGGLYAALTLPLAFLRRVAPSIRLLMWLGVAQVAAWFVLSQVGRYLIQIMPLFAVAGAYAAWRFTFQTEPVSNDSDNESDADTSVSRSPSNSVWERLPGWIGIAAIMGQAAYVLSCVCTLPMNAKIEDRLVLAERGQLPSNVSVPTLFANAAQPETWKEDLRRRFDAYKAMEWINANTPKEAVIALYNETRGFYLDRSYLWANSQHSSYIPYQDFHNGQDLTAWLNGHGIRYALINLNQAAQNNQPERDPELARGPGGAELTALEKWYAAPARARKAADTPLQWIGEAIAAGQWKPLFWEHGCVVLEVGAGTAQSASGSTSQAGGGL